MIKTKVLGASSTFERFHFKENKVQLRLKISFKWSRDGFHRTEHSLQTGVNVIKHFTAVIYEF